MKKTNAKKGALKKMGIALLVILGVVVVGMGAAMIAFEPGRKEAMNLTIEPVDFHALRDGIYTGEYKGTKDSMRNAKVQVTVDKGSVSQIVVTEGALANGKQSQEIRDGKRLDDLFARVIAEQSLQVDAISGATITSKVHLKAIENALEQSEQK